MKKIIFSVSICLLFSGFIMAQQQDSTLMKSKSTDKLIQQNKDKKYTDSSGKYAPYGDPNDNGNKRNKESKSKGKRDKTDSINPKM